MPHRGLRSRQLVLRRRRHFREQQVDVAGLDGFEAVERRLRRRLGERLRVVGRSSRRVHRVQVHVMKVHRLDFRPALLRVRRQRDHD